MTRRLWGAPSVLAAAWLVASTFAVAQTSSDADTALRQGFEAAWSRQPERQAASLRRDAAAAQAEAAERWTPEPPAIEIAAKTDRLTENHGSREYEAAIAVPLWLPGERSRSQAAMQAERAALEARLLASRWRIAGEVRDAYWSLQLAQLDRELAQQRLAGAQQLAADVARRVRAGDLARSDQHQADGAAAAAGGAVAMAKVAVARAAQRWTALTGSAPPDADSGERPEPAPAASAEVDPAHPALGELIAQGEVARQARSLADVQRRANPELVVGATRERGSFDERYGQTLTLGVRIPLGLSSTHRAKVAAAAADQVEAEVQLALEQDRVRAEARAAANRVDAAREVLAAAERRAQLALESRGFFDKSFRLGETDLPTRLRAEFEAVEAEREAARSRIELAAAISQLRQALGLLPE